ncbi:MAG TPA: hypothetical protein VKY56_04000 [Chloroflexota bacterium]|nr:hypothetical protein [Chloroflexota bacterium]
MHMRLLAALVIVLSIAAVSCLPLRLQQSIILEMVYPRPDQTEVTIYYTVPPPPPGKIYVLWIVNPAQHEAVNVGQVPSGRDLTVHTTVNFAATGAVVSIESQPNPPTMSTTWALKAGTVTAETPTPSASSPSAADTPSTAAPSGTVSP